MLATSRPLRTLSLLVLLPLFAACGGADTADPAPGATQTVRTAPRTYELPYRGTVTFEVPESWAEQVRLAAGGLAMSVEYREPEGDAFRVAISIRWSEPCGLPSRPNAGQPRASR